MRSGSGFWRMLSRCLVVEVGLTLGCPPCGVVVVVVLVSDRKLDVRIRIFGVE